MGTSLDGIDLGLKSLLSTKPWIRDPAVVPLPYRQEIFDNYLARGLSKAGAGGKRLKIGIVWRDGIVEPHPPIRRGLKLLAEAVKNAGHKVSICDSCVCQA
jgi:amidase